MGPGTGAKRWGVECAGDRSQEPITKPDFYPEIPDFFPVEPEKNPVLFPSGNFAGANGPQSHWKLRWGAPGRTGIFHVPPLHTWSEGHRSLARTDGWGSVLVPTIGAWTS